jgi:hypothetical protein
VAPIEVKQASSKAISSSVTSKVPSINITHSHTTPTTAEVEVSDQAKGTKKRKTRKKRSNKRKKAAAEVGDVESGVAEDGEV